MKQAASDQDNSIESLISRVADDFAARLSRGERPQIDEYAAKYPEYANVIEQVLGSVAVMQDLDLNRELAGDLTPSGQSPQQQLGDFRIMREIGRGGMGIVFEAQQLSMDRRVALKVLPFAALLDDRQLQRFKNESRAAGTLHHPHIVPVYSVGVERGVHYYAMQYIEGPSLAEVLNDLLAEEAGDARDVTSDPSDRPPTASPAESAVTSAVTEKPESANTPITDTRRELQALLSTVRSSSQRAYFEMIAKWGVQACEALAHAHERGVLHRDIKPGNLLLDGAGNIYVADFGVARIEADAGVTMTGDLVGTLRYMAPEQVLTKRVVVDHRVDIYSLGVTLYELITLKPAFDQPNRPALLKQIANEEPTAPRRIERLIPADLETIVLKAMAKDPAERYDTAQQLADDLQAFLDERPVAAQRPSLLDRSFKWSRRHRGVTAACVGALAVTVVCFATTTVLVTGALHKTRDAQNQTVEQRDAALSNLYVANIRLAQEEFENGHLAAVYDLLDEHIPVENGPDRRGWEWYFLKSLCHRDEATLLGHSSRVYSVDYSPNGSQLATGGKDSTIKIWDAATGRELKTLLGHTDVISSVRWSPNGELLASAAHDNTIRVWDVAAGASKVKIDASNRPLMDVAWNPDGTRLASCGNDSTVRLWDPKTGEMTLELKGHVGGLFSVAWSPDGLLLASVSGYRKRAIRIWDPSSGELVSERLHAHDDAIWHLDWSPDGQRLATGSLDQTVKIWDVDGLNNQLEINARSGLIRSVSWSPDGKTVATAGGDGSLNLWDSRSGQATGKILGHRGSVTSAAWRFDGKRLASASKDGTAKIWDPHLGPPEKDIRTRSVTNWSPNGRHVAVCTEDRIIQIYDAKSGTAVETPPFVISDEGMKPCRLAWSPTGQHFACAGMSYPASGSGLDHIVKVFDSVTRREIHSFSVPSENNDGEVRSVTWSPDGNRLASAMWVKGFVVIWDVTNGQEIARLKHDDHTDCAVWSPDGKQLATSSWDQIVKVWDTTTWREVLKLNRHPEGAWGAGGDQIVAWSPDGQILAAGTVGGWVVMWDPVTGREIRSFSAHTEGVRSIAFSPDSHRLVTASLDRTLKIWTLAGQQLLTLRGHKHGLYSVSWSPDKTRILSMGGDELKIWSADPLSAR